MLSGRVSAAQRRPPRRGEAAASGAALHVLYGLRSAGEKLHLVGDPVGVRSHDADTVVVPARKQ